MIQKIFYLKQKLQELHRAPILLKSGQVPIVMEALMDVIEAQQQDISKLFELLVDQHQAIVELKKGGKA